MHSHTHGGSHCHHEGTAQILKWSTIATVLFVVVEVVAGLKSGSLALLSDAGHNVTEAMAFAIGALIVWSAWDIVNESLNILLEGLPRGIELQTVSSAMREVPGVLDVHDLHIWSLGSSTHALSCHALIEDVPPSASDRILQCLN